MNIENITNSKLAMKLAKRFPETAIALAIYLSSFNEPKPGEFGSEDGYKEMVLGQNNEPIKIISKPSNYDLVTIEEKQADGTWKTRSEICEKVYDPRDNQ